VYAIVLGPPAAGEVTIEADGLPPGPVRLLGWDGVLYRRGTTVTLPAPDGARPGYVLAFTP
jgi:hypothetical protein